MTDKLFITIKTYNDDDLNQKGHELQKYIKENLDHVVIPKYMFKSIKNDIEHKCKELDARYPETYPFVVNSDMRNVDFATDKYPEPNIEINESNDLGYMGIISINTTTIKYIFKDVDD